LVDEVGPRKANAEVERAAAEAAAGGTTDTEHLRQLMQRYRSLFHQLSRS
jgi:hypothetical protein